MELKFTFRQVMGLLTVLFLGTGAMAQISIPNASFTDAQDFSTLVNTGTSSTVPAGWAFSEAGANQNALYTAGTGSSNTGDTYSFGPTAPNTERAFGGLQTGSLNPTVGVCYTNNTTATITELTVTYTGETWRVGTASRTDGIQFQYNQSTTGIGGAGTWTSFPALDYFNPGQAVGSGSMLHSATISSPITGLSIAPGATFCFRWNDFNATGSDDGIGIDNYSLTNIVAPSPCDAITPLTCGTAFSQSLTGAGFWNTSFCGNSTVGSEAVYSFTPTMSGLHTLIINGVGGGTVDFGYKLASDGCSSSGWNCIGTSTGTGYFTFGPLTAGAQYYILLDAHTTDFSAQNFEINCNVVPTNDLCVNAITIPAVTGNICGTTLGANPDNPNGGVNCGTGADGAGAGVWYTFVGTGQDWSFFFPQQSTDWDPEVNVYSGSCGALTCVTGDDDSGGGLNAQFTVSNTVAGTTYYVYVHPADDFGNGTSDFCFTVTTTLPPCPTFSGAPANVSITNSSCGSGCTLTGGSITAPTGTPCPAGSTLQYNVNNAGWTTSLPVYDQDGPAQSIRTRCACDNDANNVSAESNPVSTIPGTLANPVVPANGAATVACPALATQPTPPVVMACNGSAITPTGPTVTNNPNPLTCEGTRTYTWTYSCGTTSSTWSFVYTIERQPFTVPANGAATVNSPALATQPMPPTVLSNCGETLTPTGPVVTNSPNPVVCTGTRTYAWTYTDCEGNTAIWSFIYTIIDNTPPTVTAGTIAACYTSVAAAEAAAIAATTASDLCSTPTKTASTTGTCSAVITVTATDASNNSASVTYNTRIDNTPPTLVCRTGTVLLNNSSSYALTAADVFNAAASSDNCPGTLTVTNISPANISCSQVGQTIPVVVTVQDGCGNSATCTAQITVQEGTALPSGWSSANVGNANGSAGFKACSGQAFTVTASGFSTLNSDVMHVAYQQLCGNGSIKARVANVTGGGWAGVIMRETLSPGAKKAVLKTQLNNNIRRDLRLATNGVTSALNFFRPQHQWLQLTRSGNILTGYTSFDGTNWDFAFTAAISMTSCIQVGVFSESINANAVTTATFTNVVVTGTTPALAEGTSTGFESAEQVLSDFNITLAPNPSQGLVNLQFLAAPKVPVTIEVFNLLGECISRLPNQQLDGASLQLDLSGQAAGVYLVHISTADATPVVKQLVLTH